MNYVLAEACQNKFVLFEREHLTNEILKEAHAALAKEKRDDALILVDGHAKDEDYYVRMVVLGLDNELGEFCGNGSRATAAYLYAKYKQYKHIYIVTKERALLLTKFEGDIYSIQMPKVSLKLNDKFIAKPELFKKDGISCYLPLFGKKFYYAEAIEPHLILMENISQEELLRLGKELNQRKDIFPLSINLNSCSVLGSNYLSVKTYERGVQRLTLSCGTGSLSSVAIYLAGANGKVKVLTPGGVLEITQGDNFVELKGPATLK